MRVVLNRIAEDLYSVYDSCTHTTESLTQAELLKHPEIAGVSDDGIMLFRSFEDYIDYYAVHCDMCGEDIRYKCIQEDGVEHYYPEHIGDGYMDRLRESTDTVRIADYGQRIRNDAFSLPLSVRKFRVIDFSGVTGSVIQFQVSSVVKFENQIEVLHLPVFWFRVSQMTLNSSHLRHIYGADEELQQRVRAEIGDFPVIKSELAMYVFSQCKQLETVDFAAYEMTDIPFYGFAGCDKLHDLKLPKTKVIGAHAFEDCKALKQVEIPNCVEHIRSGAFKGAGLRGIVLPESMETLESGVFEDCTELRSVNAEYVLSCTQPDTFKGCTALQSCVFGENLQELDVAVFRGCNSMKEVHVPQGATLSCDHIKLTRQSPVFLIHRNHAERLGLQKRKGRYVKWNMGYRIVD